MTISMLPVVGRPLLPDTASTSSAVFLPSGESRVHLLRAALRAAGAIGNALLEWSFEPIGFSFAVLFLQIHHQLLASGFAASTQVIGR